MNEGINIYTMIGTKKENTYGKERNRKEKNKDSE